MKYGYKGADRLLYFDRWLENLAHFVWSWNKLLGITGLGLILLSIVIMVVWLWLGGEHKVAFATASFGSLTLSFLCGVELDLRLHPRNNLP